MEVFKDDMESEETHYRVNAVHRLRIVVTLLGPDKIKS